jgi:hypothetical protein
MLDIGSRAMTPLISGLANMCALAIPTIHTNTIEGSFSIFKRDMKGVYQHCGKQRLHRYLAEFDFRYSGRFALGVTDSMYADKALKDISGKRLTYRRTGVVA